MFEFRGRTCVDQCREYCDVRNVRNKINCDSSASSSPGAFEEELTTQ
jgi:hypothetical protein